MKKITMVLMSVLFLGFVGCEMEDCCKHCTNSKPCGDSCIPYNYTCHKPPGCACSDNGDVYEYEASNNYQSTQENNYEATTPAKSTKDSCCRHCSTFDDMGMEIIIEGETTIFKPGCACGNRCIPCDNVCNVESGCACDL